MRFGAKELVVMKRKATAFSVAASLGNIRQRPADLGPLTQNGNGVLKPLTDLILRLHSLESLLLFILGGSIGSQSFPRTW